MPSIGGTNCTSFFVDDEGNLRVAGLYDVLVTHPLIIKKDIVDVDCGYHFAVCVDNEGIVWKFGDEGYFHRIKIQHEEREKYYIPQMNSMKDNLFHWIGLGTDYNPSKFNLFKQVKLTEEIRAVFCGCYHTMCIDTCNNVYSFGENVYGQLGLGHTNNQDSPCLIDNIPSIHSISCGEYFTIFLTMDREIYSCGKNSNGQLGFNEDESVYTPTKVDYFQNVSAIACGNYHTLVLDNNGEVYGFGSNTSRQLGLSDEIQNISQPQKLKVPLAKAISCGATSSMIHTTNNRIYTSGSNCLGQLGIQRSNVEEFSQLISFQDVEFVVQLRYATFVKKSSELWSFGQNRYKEICTSFGGAYNLPSKIDEKYSNIIASPNLLPFHNSRIKSARK